LKKLLPGRPADFFKVRVDAMELRPPLLGVCAGYECGKWRTEQLVTHLFEYLPEFALTDTEQNSIGKHNMVRLLGQAARSVYTSPRFKRRGEIGELLLHSILRQTQETVPAISKYFYKDSSNDTVKGFDAVHVVATRNRLELWLGEVKFYEKVGRAITDAVKELQQHTQRSYLRSEFVAIVRKVDSRAPFKARLSKLLEPNRSLNDIFDDVCIPVLIAYESEIISNFKAESEHFKELFDQEVRNNWLKFSQNNLPTNVRIKLFFFPVFNKQSVLKQFDQKLKTCQTL
jgi:Cap4 SAVED domain